MGKAIGFVVVLGLMGLSSWLISRKSKRILGQALGREIRDGEETSLRAWMAVPDAQLGRAADEMSRPMPLETALGAMDSVGRAMRPMHANAPTSTSPIRGPTRSTSVRR